MKNVEPKVWIALGVVLVLYLGFMVLLIAALPKQREKKKPQFDERQRLAQGDAYKWSFWAMFTYYTLYVLICGAGDIHWCDEYLGMFLGVILGATVFGTICILRDAYVRLGQSRAAALISSNVIMFSQGFLGLTHLREGTVIENGVLSADALQLFLPLFALTLDVACLIKRRMEKREAAAEETE